MVEKISQFPIREEGEAEKKTVSVDLDQEEYERFREYRDRHGFNDQTLLVAAINSLLSWVRY